MEWNLKTVGIVTALFFLGYIIGLVEAAIKQRVKDKKTGGTKQDANEALASLPDRAPDLFSLNLDDSGSLLPAIKGHFLHSKEDLTTENRQMLVNLLVKLRPWLEAGELEKPVVEPASAAPQVSVPSVFKQDIKPTQTLKPKKGEKLPPPESMVAQIDSVLQKQLAGSSLAGRGIRLAETPEGGVQVWVGVKIYDGIDAVPEADVKDAIKRAVADWEKRP